MSKEITFMNAEKKVVKMTVDELQRFAANSARVREITVSGDRNINKGNFENERYGQETRINFDIFWDLFSPEVFHDAEAAKTIQTAFANGVMDAIGTAYRDVYIYQLYCVTSRSRELNLPQTKGLLREISGLEGPDSFDPFNVRQKEGS